MTALLAGAMIALLNSASGAAPWTFTPSGKVGFTVLDEDLTPLINMETSIHGKDWTWTVGNEIPRLENDIAIYQESFKETYGEFDYKVTMGAADGGKVVIEAECKAVTETEFTGIGLNFASTRGQNGGQIEFVAEKNAMTVPLPIKNAAMIEQASQAVITFADTSNRITLDFSPPLNIHVDRGSARFLVLHGENPGR